MKKNILIAARTDKACEMYKSMLDENKFTVTTMTDAASVRLTDMIEYTAVFISLPLADESGLELLDEISKKSDIPVGAIVKSDLPDKVINRLLSDNAYILRKPVSHSVLTVAAELLTSFFSNSSHMREKISELERKNDEIKLMSRAKLMLIESRGMTENDAHRYVLRRAMNSQSSIGEVCRKIINEGSGQV